MLHAYFLLRYTRDIYRTRGSIKQVRLSNGLRLGNRWGYREIRHIVAKRRVLLLPGVDKESGIIIKT